MGGVTKARCIAGHPLSGDNLYVSPKGIRGCRMCRNSASQRAKAKRALQRRNRKPESYPVAPRALRPPSEEPDFWDDAIAALATDQDDEFARVEDEGLAVLTEVAAAPDLVYAHHLDSSPGWDPIAEVTVRLARAIPRAIEKWKREHPLCAFPQRKLTVSEAIVNEWWLEDLSPQEQERLLEEQYERSLRAFQVQREKRKRDYRDHLSAAVRRNAEDKAAFLLAQFAR